MEKIRYSEGRNIEKRALFYHFPIYLQAYNVQEDNGTDPLFRTRPGSVIIKDKWKLHHYFENNKEPILNEKTNDINLDGTQDETVKRILEVLDTKIRPAVARDGGDIKFKSFQDGVVKVELQGSCSGCPSSVMTLKQGVQNLLKHYVKEVQSVEAV